MEFATVKTLFRFEGLNRVPVQEVLAGDIAVVSGFDEMSIGDTLCDPECVEPLPAIVLDEPTISMVFYVNNSPFAGLDGDYVTSRQILGRLEKAAARDVALQLAPTGSADAFEALFTAPTLHEILEHDDGKMIGRINPTREALTHYGHHLSLMASNEKRMRNSFRDADWDALARLWAEFYPPKYHVDAALLKQNTVECPVFDWGASVIEVMDDETLGFVAVK